MQENSFKDAFWEELRVWDEVVYKYEHWFSKWVITHIPEQKLESYRKSIVVYFYKRNRSWFSEWIKQWKRSEVQTVNCVKIS